MSPLFKKLNLGQHVDIVVLNAPASFEPELRLLSGVRIGRDAASAEQIAFALVFANRQTVVDALSPMLAAKATDDAVLWFAYPKGTSKTLRCDFNRDNGWAVLKGLGFDTVRQVAIDADWSALRFRRVQHIGR